MPICNPSFYKNTTTDEKIADDFSINVNIKNYPTYLKKKRIKKRNYYFFNNVQADFIALCTHDRTGLTHYIKQVSAAIWKSTLQNQFLFSKYDSSRQFS